MNDNVFEYVGSLLQRVADYLGSLLQPAAYGMGSISVELILIGLVVYTVLRFLHGTRGARILQSIAVLLVVGFLVVTVLADNFRLTRIAVLYRPFVWTIFLTALVVFQPELRRGLMRLGERRWRRNRRSEIEQVVRPVATACAQLSKNKIGALIAIERDIGLSGLIEQGVRLDAKLSPELLNTIFWPGSALHDLGVIVQRGRVAAAGCPFPLGDAEGVDRSIGSRHRAAIGLSMDSDAVVVAVSEETGAISIAENGRLHRHIPPDGLYGMLKRYLNRDRVGTGWTADSVDTPALPPRSTTGADARAPSSEQAVGATHPAGQTSGGDSKDSDGSGDAGDGSKPDSSSRSAETATA